MTDVQILDIVGCARCHGDGHKGLRFLRLLHEVEGDPPLTHWATCPTTGEPILMGFVKPSAQRCNRPPFGWRCYLPRDHEGSCPAHPLRRRHLLEVPQRIGYALKRVLLAPRSGPYE